MNPLAFISMFIVAVALVGCGDRQNQNDASTRRLCTQEARSGMGITVSVPSGANPTQFVNELEGTVTVDNDVVALVSSLSQNGKTASLYGAWEATGMLSVQVTYRTASGRLDNVKVETDGCHTLGASLTGSVSGNTISLTRVR